MLHINWPSLKQLAAAVLSFTLRLLVFVAAVGFLVVGIVQPKDWTAWLYSDHAPLAKRVEESRRKIDELQRDVDVETKLEGELNKHKTNAEKLTSDIADKDVDIARNNARNTSDAERNGHDQVLQAEKKRLIDSRAKENDAIADLNAKLTNMSTPETELESDKRERDAEVAQLATLDANLDGASYYARLFSLGGLGALVTLLNAYRRRSTSLIKTADLGRNISGIVVGGIVAVAATNLVMAGAINPFKISIADVSASKKTLLLVGLALCSGAASEYLVRALVSWVESHPFKRIKAEPSNTQDRSDD